MAAAAPKITLYTNDGCPWAHRARIALKELDLPYETVIIDLTKPREQWYLDINPRGLVPTLIYNSETITESGVVAQFLADAHPSHLSPNTGTPEAALKRARTNFFVDAWFSKVNSFSQQIALLADEKEKEKEELARNLVAAVEKEIEPLLKGAGPFFGGSERLGLAEVLTAPFIIRLLALSTHAVLPPSIATSLHALPHFSKWAAAVAKHDSVTEVFDEERIVAALRGRYEKLRGEKEKKGGK